ncbi:hypothetical protein B296_00019535 [Ensete ventricosum]|uniref:Uncharacterized protein n=1 Tax=Ensete ventricosum TaxID=4639 RepID=A0A426ZYM8_ENSVE|nr:hypothetical protein B296_00019535 [Ensete ventricosum]
MPPKAAKSKDAVTERAILGRFSSHLKIGIVRSESLFLCLLGAFEDPDIIHVDDTVDPVRDLEIIGEELRLKDVEFIEKKLEDLEKSMKRSNDKQLKIEHELCDKVGMIPF